MGWHCGEQLKLTAETRSRIGLGTPFPLPSSLKHGQSDVSRVLPSWNTLVGAAVSPGLGWDSASPAPPGLLDSMSWCRISWDKHSWPWER